MKKKKPFWKKMGPEAEHISAHIGHIVNNSRISDFIDVALYGGLAVAGYDLFKDWKGALLGPVSLRLATTRGGTPPVAQIAGVTGLALLGVSSAFVPEGQPPPSKTVPEALPDWIPPEEKARFVEEHKAHFQYLDILHTVQQVMPTGIFWNMLWSWLKK